jgi:hypothetical protein
MRPAAAASAAVLAAASTAVLAVAAFAGGGGRVPADAAGTPSPSATRASSGSAAEAAAGFRSPRTYSAVAPPVRLRIPSIGVDAPLENLGLEADGSIAAPQEWQDAGWYAGGPRPGQPGPAVLLGHVDSRTGPAVFHRLAGLPSGALVLVDRADRTTARFRVQGRLQVAKSRFPSELVYGATLTPSLRLVTCGGTFDRQTGHYRDNVVVTAVPERGGP